MSTAARKRYQRLTNFTFAFVLAVSSLTAALPFVFSQVANAADGDTVTLVTRTENSVTLNYETVSDVACYQVQVSTGSTAPSHVDPCFGSGNQEITYSGLNAYVEVRRLLLEGGYTDWQRFEVLAPAPVADPSIEHVSSTSNSVTVKVHNPSYANPDFFLFIEQRIDGVDPVADYYLTDNETVVGPVAASQYAEFRLMWHDLSIPDSVPVYTDWQRFDVLPSDTTAPSFAITSPVNGTVVNGIQTINAVITDESDIAKVLMTVPTKTGNKTFTWEQGKLNNSLIRTGDNFSVTIDTTTLNDGLTHVVLRGTDTLGNVRYWNNNAANRQHGFIVDNTQPTTPQIITPSNEQYFKTTPIQSKWTASTDANGILKYQIEYIYDDGHTFAGGPIREVNGVTTQRNHTPASHEQGGVTIRVRAVDTLGNVSDWSDPVHYYYDATPPTSTDNLATTVSGTVTITQTISDNVEAKNGKLRIWKLNGGVQDNTQFYAIGDVNVDADGKIQYVLNTVANLYGDGEYLAKFTARDQAGHEIVTQKIFTVDNTGPDVSVNGETYATNQPVITGGVDSSAQTVFVEIKDTLGTVISSGFAQYVAGETGWSYATTAPFVNGSYTVSATAADEYGNEKNAQATVTVAVVIITPDDPETPEEDETETEIQTVVTPIITPPSANGDQDVQGATDENDQGVEGSAIETPAQVDTDGSDGTIFGLAWYWWIAILAALAAIIWGIIAALRRRQEA